MTFKYRYRKQILLCFGVLFTIASGVFLFIYNKPKTKKVTTNKEVLVKKSKKEKEDTKDKTKEEDIKEIMVDVKGEVVNEGIYKLKEGSRVIDAIQLAGGITQNGDTSVLNLSKKLEDEMVIIVYSYYEVRNFEKVREVNEIVSQNCMEGFNGVSNDACIETEQSNNNSTTKISINKATLEELMKLPGIGEAKAKSIIEYREKNGEFQNIEQLKEVNGIGDSLFDQIKENITI